MSNNEEHEPESAENGDCPEPTESLSEDSSAIDEVMENLDGASSDEMPEPTVEEQLQTEQENNLRLLAELDNVRKRTQRDRQQQLQYASLPVISDLLSVVDDLHRALQAAETSGDVESLQSGVEMVVQSFVNVLGKHNCDPIVAQTGQEFDVNLHEAISMQPNDQWNANTIINVVQQGYQMHDRVIRPSQVIVSSGPSEALADESDDR